MAAIEYFFRVVITSSKHRGAGAWYGRILESHASRVYITVLNLVIRVRRTRRRYILRLTLLTDICYRLLSLDDSILVSLLQPYQVWLNLPVKRWMQRYCKSESHDKKVQPNWNRSFYLPVQWEEQALQNSKWFLFVLITSNCTILKYQNINQNNTAGVTE